ncbi:hypothetical protein PF005_g17470 [Phytophthora fragariae]|uniref:HSF-type DNA-binding domain-containing protein n=1 Tax=Phytophthora fragariae TaxID=53985 RepID=A0A6A3L813_9STRA|nr:hypothetical protein PF003_g22308 [Phytophthora fragariae]KAE8930898.1 hypothetical protein PF009_g19025 [Phytophthora fragariae]KAE9014047.1 hypothetical protein PF011_g8230 [Phytophthora fragariae]KAE9096654.1 hypothetical protein PF007_g16921 [Phytophthora fragariae]KAE9126301.1 hypothetical protein PF006_g16761 [Phytophthora fragariae]
MRSNEKIVDEVPRFVRTLYDILHDEDPFILSWSVDGSHFQVFDVPRLEREILPKYFKHCKFASFQRQLNNFGFRKWTKTRASVCTFSHDFLHRCDPTQLAPLVAEMEAQKAAMCAATPHIGTKRFRDESSFDEHVLRTDVKRLHVDTKQDDEREPEQEMASFSPENFVNESWPLAGFDAADLSALDWSLVTDSGREDELNTLLDPILIPVPPTVQAELGSNLAYINDEVAFETLPPLDTEYLGESWTDIFDEVTL